jgi:hypothetical protein
MTAAMRLKRTGDIGCMRVKARRRRVHAGGGAVPERESLGYRARDTVTRHAVVDVDMAQSLHALADPPASPDTSMSDRIHLPADRRQMRLVPA